jgi:biopolymer transport protein ExbB/TolQ
MPTKKMSALLFVGGIALAALVYAVLYLFVQKGPYYDFMCRRGFYQHVSTALFSYGLLLAAYRWIAFRREVASLKLAIPNERISPPDAALWADRIPSAFRDTFLGRRIAELLRGYARREDVGPLVDRLAANDREDLERSGSLLSWVRSMPPVLGLLGTLDGLRGGTAEIARISNASNVEQLRSGLQKFALSSSTAFDCTLMGIIYALVLSLFIFLLRKREDAHLGTIDKIAQSMSRRFMHRSQLGEELQELAREMRELAVEFTGKFLASLEQIVAKEKV